MVIEEVPENKRRRVETVNGFSVDEGPDHSEDDDLPWPRHENYLEHFLSVLGLEKLRGLYNKANKAIEEIQERSTCYECLKHFDHSHPGVDERLRNELSSWIDQGGCSHGHGVPLAGNNGEEVDAQQPQSVTRATAMDATSYFLPQSDFRVTETARRLLRVAGDRLTMYKDGLHLYNSKNDTFQPAPEPWSEDLFMDRATFDARTEVQEVGDPCHPVCRNPMIDLDKAGAKHHCVLARETIQPDTLVAAYFGILCGSSEFDNYVTEDGTGERGLYLHAAFTVSWTERDGKDAIVMVPNMTRCKASQINHPISWAHRMGGPCPNSPCNCSKYRKREANVEYVHCLWKKNNKVYPVVVARAKSLIRPGEELLVNYDGQGVQFFVVMENNAKHVRLTRSLCQYARSLEEEVASHKKKHQEWAELSQASASLYVEMLVEKQKKDAYVANLEEQIRRKNEQIARLHRMLNDRGG